MNFTLNHIKKIMCFECNFKVWRKKPFARNIMLLPHALLSWYRKSLKWRTLKFSHLILCYLNFASLTTLQRWSNSVQANIERQKRSAFVSVCFSSSLVEVPFIWSAVNTKQFQISTCVLRSKYAGKFVWKYTIEQRSTCAFQCG